MNMKNRIISLSVLLLFLAVSLHAAKVDTLLVKSPSMNKDVQVVVIAPEVTKATKNATYPVLYLLHGYSGNAKSWIELKPNLPEIADQNKMIIVCPDGKNSWYWDSPKDSSYRYETFVSDELVKYIDSHYKTVAEKKGRAITGLSMGGHGALWLAFRHKDIFGAAGSTSGGVDIRPFPTNWEMSKQLGEFAYNKKSWDEHTVINQIDKIQNGDLAIIIDCGEGDFFLNVNKDLHERLLGRKINHDFITRPGVHNGQYWNNSIDYQLLFFKKFFER
jgi:Predicted esterase